MTRKLTDRDRAMIAMHGEVAILQLIEQAEAAARAGEREAIAAYVESFNYGLTPSPAFAVWTLPIAKAIRARTPAPATEAP